MLDKQLVKIITTKGTAHFNAIFNEIQKSSPGISRKTVSSHLTRLCANGRVHRDPLNHGKKRAYSLAADWEIAALIDRDFRLFAKKKSQSSLQVEKLKENVRLVFIRLAVISYVKYLDPKVNHGPGTIFFLKDKSGNTYNTISSYLKDKMMIESAPILEQLDLVPVEFMSKDKGVSVQDLLQPSRRLSEIRNLYGHILLSKEDLKKCLDILITVSKPPVSRVKTSSNRYQINTDDSHYPVLRDYLREWLSLLLLLISRIEYIWINQRDATKEEREWYDRIFGDSHRTAMLRSAGANRQKLGRKGRKQYEIANHGVILELRKYDKEMEARRGSLSTTEKYKEFEDKYPFITKILKEEIDRIYDLISENK